MRFLTVLLTGCLLILSGCGSADQPAEKPSESADAKTATPKKKTGKVKIAGGMLTIPGGMAAKAEQKAFEMALPQLLQLFQAEHGRKPKSHEEFMAKVIDAHKRKLPKAPEGQKFVYDPTTEKLKLVPAE